MTTIAIVNQCQNKLPFSREDLVKALQEYVGLLTPVWGVTATIEAWPGGALPASGVWPLFLQDTTDEPEAGAYHAVDQGGPWGIAFLQTSIEAGMDPAVSVGHELAEMLVDPEGDLKFANYLKLVAGEIVDPVQANAFPMSNGLRMPNFVYPCWFAVPMPTCFGWRCDHLGLVQYPGQLLAGGYISEWRVETGWQERWGDAAGRSEVERKLSLPASRLNRRRDW